MRLAGEYVASMTLAKPRLQLHNAGRREEEMRLALIAAAAAAMLAAAPAPGESSDLARRLEGLARAGSPEAAYHLGMLYNNGEGVPQDPRRALSHFRSAAEGGDPLGAYKLGCYYAGQFGDQAVQPDEAEALRWKLVAARAGYSLAQLDVANIHARNERWAEALPWFEAAAHQGEAMALYNLSVIYRDGLGTQASPPRVWAMFRLSQLRSRGFLSENATRALDEVWQGLSTAQREEAERIAATFVIGPSELTRSAVNGIERARALAASAS
jgi:TPR repeat protein